LQNALSKIEQPEFKIDKDSVTINAEKTTPLYTSVVLALNYILYRKTMEKKRV
jgi:hypothetical protein